MPKLNNICREYPNTTRLLETWIYARRKELKLSQDALADRANITRNCIQQMECYEHLPRPSTLFSLMAALELSDEEIDDFMSGLWRAYREDKRLQKEKEEKLEAV